MQGATRAVVALVLALLWTPALPTAWADGPDQAALIARAYQYGFPIFEQARLVYLYSYFPGNPQRVPVNRFGHRRQLVDHTARTVTTPNNDTLYSSAVIDLSAGPVRLDVPDFGERYWSIAFIDAFTNNFFYLGTRVSGNKGGSYQIVGPDWAEKPSDGTILIRSPGNHIVAIARILIDGPEDYERVHRLQDALILSAPVPAKPAPDPERPVPGDPINFVAVVNRVLRDDPPPAADAAILSVLAAVGIGGNAGPLSEAQRRLWSDGFTHAQAELLAESRAIGTHIDGWDYMPPDIGDFGTDYRTRAIVALRGIAANIPAEMSYALAASDRTGAPLDGDRRYRLHLAPATPPAEGFWSFSIYEVTKDGGLFFGDNPIHRYAIGDRTKGLIRNSDGSFDIVIQKESPGRGGEANWLPIPAKSFVIIARAYLPRAAIVEGTYRYPGIEPMK
jgi:hypothetical protein